jgi:hypothetical protein
MSSQENVSTFQESQKTPFNSEFFKDISPQKKTFEQKVENSQLIKPIPVNIKVLKRSKSDLTTMGDSTLTIKNVVKELKMPIMYQNYNYVNLVQNGLYNEDLYYKNNLENIDKGENNSSFYKKDKPFCYCTKTQCIKKYCECFANNKYCIDCHCQNCANKLIEINPLQKNMINVLENENETNKTICTCTKSNCIKKYCECYKQGKKCNKKCRCINCINKDPINNKDNFINNNINKNKTNNNIINKNNNSENKLITEEKKIISNKSSESDLIGDNFNIQRISVFINKYHTSINVEKLSKEELNLLCKKRKYC